MIDVSANLFNALPQVPGTANRLPASRSLAIQDESQSGGNSLRGIADGLRLDAPAGNFSPPATGEQGFASLAPVLQSLQLPPTQLTPPPDDTPLWRELLDQQQERIAARDQDDRDLEALQQAQEQRAAERELLREQFSNLAGNTVFEGEAPPVSDAAQQASAELQQVVAEQENTAPLPGQAQTSSPQTESEPAPLPGQGNIEDPAAGQVGRFPPNTQFPGLQSSPPPEVEPFAELPDLPDLPEPDPAQEQQRVEQLFSGASGTENTGNNLNLFA